LFLDVLTIHRYYAALPSKFVELVKNLSLGETPEVPTIIVLNSNDYLTAPKVFCGDAGRICKTFTKKIEVFGRKSRMALERIYKLTEIAQRVWKERQTFLESCAR